MNSPGGRQLRAELLIPRSEYTALDAVERLLRPDTSLNEINLEQLNQLASMFELEALNRLAGEQNEDQN